MNRSTRRFVAWVGVLGIILAQMVATAHACRLGDAAAREHRAAVIAHGASWTPPADLHCGAHVSGADTPNLCEVHCADGATPVAGLDLPPYVQPPLAVPGISLANLARNAASVAGDDASTQGGAPPRNLQFCRLLI
jgi:hypothetical protein